MKNNYLVIKLLVLFNKMNDEFKEIQNEIIEFLQLHDNNQHSFNCIFDYVYDNNKNPNYHYNFKSTLVTACHTLPLFFRGVNKTYKNGKPYLSWSNKSNDKDTTNNTSTTELNENSFDDKFLEELITSRTPNELLNFKISKDEELLHWMIKHKKEGLLMKLFEKTNVKLMDYTKLLQFAMDAEYLDVYLLILYHKERMENKLFRKLTIQAITCIIMFLVVIIMTL